MAAVSSVDFKPCPHCGHTIHKWVRAKHVRACPLRPEIADAMRAALTGPDGYAVSSREYARRRATGLPGHGALQRAFGTWAQVCAHFGLTARAELRTVQCQHCGKQIDTRYSRLHADKCPQRPEVAAALRAVLCSEIDGCLASRAEYDFRRAPGMPNGSTLCEHFGRWEALAEYFDLPLRSREATRRRHGRGISEQAWVHTPQPDPLLVGAKRAAWDYGEFDGLPVCNARALPGGGVAYVLR